MVDYGLSWINRCDTSVEKTPHCLWLVLCDVKSSTCQSTNIAASFLFFIISSHQSHVLLVEL